ncbi:MAG: selenocysteine-specific translation elongation factor [Thermodesulfobacteriota bacterium]|nr:selenocysteine-specific translation elongation factor [Thermodesulfobacteriota bacterium]
MKQLILGTAGHIDHGKSSLVRALTGVDPDRLKEEKKRGITIELGFASLALPDGRKLGIVDVPGHEKFVKNMVAGASGIDMVAMVIAADEGVMPQTREHMEICMLLGIEYGIVVLTKIDLVDAELLALVKEDVAELTSGTFLEDAPLLPVSSTTGQGLNTFPETVAAIADQIPERIETGLARLPVDRVFSMKGFGTVITGTLVAGKINAGDMVEIYPAGIRSKVRGVQVHGASVETAEAGMRTAINFQGIEKSKIEKGYVVGLPDTLIPSYMLDIDCHYLAHNPKPLKNRTLVRVHAGTTEVLGNLMLLDREDLAPGDTAIVQLRLKAPVICVRNDNIVIRSYSPLRTIGGGRVLNPVPRKHKRYMVQRLSSLRQTEGEGGFQALAEMFCEEAGNIGVTFTALKVMTCASDARLRKTLDNLLSARTIVLVDKDRQIYVHRAVLDRVTDDILSFIDGFHRTNPLKKGVSRQEVKSRIAAKTGDRLFERIVQQLIKSDQLAQDGDVLRLPSHAVALQSDHSDIRKKMLALYEENGLTPPYFKDVPATLDIKDPKAAKDVLQVLIEAGELIKVKEDLYFHHQAIASLTSELVGFLQANTEINTPRFKEMTNTSRKYTIPLLEYFDAKKITIRIGDVRKLRP